MEKTLTLLADALRANESNMHRALITLGTLALMPHTETAWADALHDARRATEWYKEAEAAFDARLDALEAE